MRLVCSGSSVDCEAHTTSGWQDKEAKFALAHQPSWCLPLRLLCNAPCSCRRTQKHVFVLTPCFEITRKLLAPSVGLVLAPLQTHSHHLSLRVCWCNRTRGDSPQGGSVTAVLRVMTWIMREESEGRDALKHIHSACPGWHQATSSPTVTRKSMSKCLPCPSSTPWCR